MSIKKASLTICQNCRSRVTIVFLLDNNGVVFTPVTHRNDLVLSVIATKEFPYPEAPVNILTGKPLWLCPKCLEAHLDKQRDHETGS